METISETKRILCQSIKVKGSSFYEYSGKYMEGNRNRKGIGDFEAVTSEKGRQVCGGAGPSTSHPYGKDNVQSKRILYKDNMVRRLY